MWLRIYNITHPLVPRGRATFTITTTTAFTFCLRVHHMLAVLNDGDSDGVGGAELVTSTRPPGRGWKKWISSPSGCYRKSKLLPNFSGTRPWVLIYLYVCWLFALETLRQYVPTYCHSPASPLYIITETGCALTSRKCLMDVVVLLLYINGPRNIVPICFPYPS